MISAVLVTALRNAPQPFSIVEKLKNLTKYMSTDSFFIELQIEGQEEGFSRQSLTTLFRAAQEGLTNIQKHAKATHIIIKLSFGTLQADLLISDNGIGFNPNNVDLNGQHYV
jgi:signal transduction histidine kinase